MISRLFVIAAAVFALAGAAYAKVELSLELDREAVSRGGEAGLEVLAHIERGWHINGHKPTESFLIPTVVTVTGPAGITLEAMTYPPADRHTFAFAKGKELLVYEGKVGITSALKVPVSYTEDFVRLQAEMRYQACNDTTCLAPATARAELVVPVSAAGARSSSGIEPPATFAGAFDVGAWLTDRGLAVTLGLVFLLGLGLNLTPCVYPLISITIAYFGSQSHQHTSRTIALACSYVLGITLTFAALGLAAALSGSMFGVALQKPVVLIFLAAVLVMLALSSFGLYQIRPPSWLLQRLGGSAPGVLGSLFMGATMGVVAAPCVGPVVLALLVFVGSQQDLVLGFSLFFVLGLGMGVPYIGLALAAGSIKALPRSGEWMLWVERLFGFVLIGLAIYFVRPLLPVVLQKWALPGIAAIAGIYLGFIDPSGRSMPYFRTAQWVTGTVALILAGWIATPQAAQSTIDWLPFDPAKLEVVRQGKPAVIDFVADWCIPCHEMENSTFVHSDVLAEAKRFVMLRADITRETDDSAAWLDQLEVEGVPTVIYLDSGGREVKRLVGYVGPEEMIAAMRSVQ
ncbi:MAG TPA: cytochrome c biogenesis protein CcdA [Terriglobales bacterium]|nr:cytochrome c biogenesis protein CcdA [Terriglobales bacterium]